MTVSITCPMCQMDVSLQRGQAEALCGDCHDLDEVQLGEEVQRRVDRALWSAVRAMEDQAAYVRWAQTEGKPAPGGEQVAGDAAVLRSILDRRRAS